MERGCTIHPILTAQVEFDLGIFTYLRNYGKRELIPIWSWLIKSDDDLMLVDAGSSLREFLKYARFASAGIEGISIEQSLRDLGYSVSDIRTIIMTHLHRDHCLNLREFPRARIIVQERELRFAMNPHPLFSSFYGKECYEGIKFEVIDGDVEIIPGVNAILTPGHTPGSQSVCITMKRRRVVIAGMCTVDDNFSKEGHIIPGSHVDPLAAYDSMVKIRQIADVIIPLHGKSGLGFPLPRLGPCTNSI